MKYTIILSGSARRNIRYLLRQGIMNRGEHPRDETGDMPLEEYARLHHLELDADAYRREFPEDAPFTHSRA